MKNNMNIEVLRGECTCMNRSRRKRHINKYQQDALTLNEESIKNQENLKRKDRYKRNNLELNLEEIDNQIENGEITLEIKKIDKVDLLESKLDDVVVRFDIEDIEQMKDLELENTDKLKDLEVKVEEIVERDYLKLDKEDTKENIEIENINDKEEIDEVKNLDVKVKGTDEIDYLNLDKENTIKELEVDYHQENEELKLEDLEEIESLGLKIEYIRQIENKEIYEEKTLNKYDKNEVFITQDNLIKEYIGQIYKGNKIIFDNITQDMIIGITNINRELEVKDIEILEKGINVYATIYVSINYATSKDIFTEGKKFKENNIVLENEKMPIISADGVVRHTTVLIPCKIYISDLEIKSLDEFKVVDKSIKATNTQYILDDESITNKIIPVGRSLRGIIENYIVSIKIEAK